MTDSTWKILKLDWKTPGKRVGTLLEVLDTSAGHVSVVVNVLIEMT